MYVCVRVWVRKTFIRKESKEREKSEEEKTKTYSYRQTDRQTYKQTDRHKSFIDMTYNTEQYSKSNSIK